MTQQSRYYARNQQFLANLAMACLLMATLIAIVLAIFRPVMTADCVSVAPCARAIAVHADATNGAYALLAATVLLMVLSELYAQVFRICMRRHHH